MFIRSSALIYPSLYLLTLGATCRYAVCGEDGSITLSDPGASAHIPALIDRLSRLGLDPSNVSNIILTHLDFDRCAGMALLRRACPKARLCGTAAMKATIGSGGFVDELLRADRHLYERIPTLQASKLPSHNELSDALHIDRLLVETDSIQLEDGLTIRSVSTPGHRAHSTSYLVVPHEFIITDETLGYYRGSRLAAPGADTSITRSLQSIAQFDHLEVSGIGFPYGGAVTGTLARRHLSSIRQNSRDLIEQYQAALRDGVSAESAQHQVWEAFYESAIHDPFLAGSLRGSFDAIMSQLSRLTHEDA